MKKAFFGKEREAPISPHQSLVIGVIAGALGPLCNNPFDVAKTRLMAQSNKPGEAPRYRGTIHCISSVWREVLLHYLFLISNLPHQVVQDTERPFCCRKERGR